MRRFELYFHTLRYLRLVQIVARFRSRFLLPKVDSSKAPGLRTAPAAYREPIPGNVSLVERDTFRLLNLERRCATAADWHPRDAEKLWIYNLHYFDDLNARDAQSRVNWHQDLLQRWVVEVPSGRGDAWEPYPVSRRIVNWVKWSLRGNPLSPQLIQSLAAQTRWLLGRLEFHLLGNHLFANAKALLYAGLYFEGTEAEAWRARGSAIIERELSEQVLEDGGHFELSPMYHASVLEDLMDLINIQQTYGLPVASDWGKAVARMRRWLSVMSHPDGELAFFNDSSFGISPSRKALEQYADRLGLPASDLATQPVTLLRDSGYVRLRAAQAYLLCDCGPVGPSYQPGHAHADTLSFELSLGGKRTLVNSGTSQYGVGAERHRQRSTAAHNTVVVDGQNSSEVWAGFRVARRAQVIIHDIRGHEELIADASHDGYRRLAGRNEHRRRWELRNDSLNIRDHISGRFDSADAFFHLHPGVEVTVRDASSVALSRPEGDIAIMRFHGAAVVDVGKGSWHPTFGVAESNYCIRVRFAGATLVTNIDWGSLL